MSGFIGQKSRVEIAFAVRARPKTRYINRDWQVQFLNERIFLKKQWHGAKAILEIGNALVFGLSAGCQIEIVDGVWLFSFLQRGGETGYCNTTVCSGSHIIVAARAGRMCRFRVSSRPNNRPALPFMPKTISRRRSPWDHTFNLDSDHQSDVDFRR